MNTSSTGEPLGRRGHRRVLVFVLVWLVGGVAAAASPYWSQWTIAGTLDSGTFSPTSMAMRSVPFDAPGIDHPDILTSPPATLVGDSEPVIGVIAGGNSRAYAVKALSHGARSHIVNDVVGDVPITVTYCDLHRCTRVFTGGQPGETLDVSQGGLRAGSMVLKVGGQSYRQDSAEAFEAATPPFPYQVYPSEETTWGDWRRRHAESGLYLGESAGTTDVVYQGPTEASGVLAEIRRNPLDVLFPFLYDAAAPLLTLFVTFVVHLLVRTLVGPRQRLAAGA